MKPSCPPASAVRRLRLKQHCRAGAWGRTRRRRRWQWQLGRWQFNRQKSRPKIWPKIGLNSPCKSLMKCSSSCMYPFQNGISADFWGRIFKSIEFGSVPFCSVFTQTLLNAEKPSESFAYLGRSTTMDGGGGVLHMCLDVAAVGGKRFIFPPPPPPRASPPPPLALHRRRRRSRFP